METTKILPAGDSAVSVQFGETIDPAIYEKVRSLDGQLRRSPVAGVVETVPTYRSLMIHYDPAILPWKQLEQTLRGLLAQSGSAEQTARKVITVPVLFGGELGMDLADVAQYHHTTPEEIVRRFCDSEFLIYMLGFTPGYPYIGGVPEGLQTPRLASPRLKTPAGSVGIGGAQLGIYPIESPGGFRIVGNTPLRLYDPDRKSGPVLLEAGESIRFAAIGPEEYEQIRRQVEEGSYVCQIREA